MDEHERTPGEENLLRRGPQMTAREAREQGNKPTGEYASGERLAERDVTRDSSQRDERDAPDDRPFTHGEAALGGADSVQKTTWGVGSGTEPVGTTEYAPVGLRKGEGPVVARTAPGGGMNPIAWVAGILGALALGAYALGIFS